ncbi:sugar transferase [Pengzhenrongella sicca]|uniref:Sugar transferase n=1 Tax=Pengzhenrongella sicca TaxID=2819238 RepID=A0A8A4ZAC5_9MICO|nr:sugar transferase [Pengzhenrongella sicca]QTE28910.1 sugar transferase [Pengzhenrongella sicca]
MTLTADRELEWQQPSDDRRGRAAGPRRSWASANPFVVRSTPHNDSELGADRWARAVARYRRVAVALDALVATVVTSGFMLAIVGRQPETIPLIVLGAVGFVACIAINRGYDERSLGDGPGEYQAVVQAGLLAAVTLMAVSYASMAEISRSLVFFGVPTLVLLSCLTRITHRRLLQRERVLRGSAMRRTLVVGDLAAVERVVGDLQRRPREGYHITGVCVPSLDDVQPRSDLPILGAVADVPQVVADRGIEVVVVAGKCLSGDALRRLSWALGRAGAHLVVAPDLVEVHAPRISLRPVAGLSLLEVEVSAPRRRQLAKATMDRAVGVALLTIAAPIIGVGALMVRATSPGSPFYRQTRVGVDGRTFTMWKLRSMYRDANARRDALLASSDGDGVLFKMRDDPRVTPVGRVLRRYSLDELPQLINVVKGDMSLVGPRPPLAEEVAAYGDSVHRRLRVKPGLTGLWQISGRSDLSWEESVRLDLRYVDNWSVGMDLLILWRTARAVVQPSGAY